MPKKGGLRKKSKTKEPLQQPQDDRDDENEKKRRRPANIGGQSNSFLAFCALIVCCVTLAFFALLDNRRMASLENVRIPFIRNSYANKQPITEKLPKQTTTFPPHDKETEPLQKLLNSFTSAMSLNIGEYGYGAKQCHHDLNVSELGKPFDHRVWENEMPANIRYSIQLARMSLAHKVGWDKAKFTFETNGSDHYVTVLVRTSEKEFSVWKPKCLQKLLDCKFVWNVILSWWGPVGEEDTSMLGSRVHTLHVPKEMGTRFLGLDMSLIRTPFLLSLDGDRCIRSCSDILPALEILHKSTENSLKVVASEFHALRGLSVVKQGPAGKCPWFPHYPAWNESRGDFSAYFLPTNAIFAKRFLEFYSNLIPPNVTKMINGIGQCEDIALAFFQVLFQEDQLHGSSNPFVFVHGIGHLVDRRKSLAGDSGLRGRCVDFFLSLTAKFGVYPHRLAFVRRGSKLRKMKKKSK